MPIHIGIEVGKKTPHTRTVRSKDRHRVLCRERHLAASADRYYLISGM